MKMLCIRLFALCAAFVLVLSATGCGEKTALSPEEFRERCEEIGFTVTEGDVGEDGTVIKLLAAKYSGYVLNYSLLPDAATARGVFDEIVAAYERGNNTFVMSLSTSFGDHSYRHFTSGNSFYLVSRIADTIIYCTADKAHKDSITETVEKLGYK
ncbi:MAG: hypothetical protein IKK83_03555 [Clostridia bacterium]|nr:hypothetical protein [Clostridia bacterium]